MERILAKELSDRLDELGLRLANPEWLHLMDDGEVVATTLIHATAEAAYRLGFSTSLTQHSVKWMSFRDPAKEPLLLVGPRVTERSADSFRSQGINYLDAAGNAFITFASVHIDVRGRRLRPSVSSEDFGPRKSGSAVNLFSVKRSQVIFALLAWEELLDRPIRQLASAAGVSLGQAQETVELLSRYGFVDPYRNLRPRQKEELLEQWTAAFPSGLGVRGKKDSFSGPVKHLGSEQTPLYISGEAAVPDLLRPETLVLYTDELPTDLIRENRWRRDETSPNIFLRHRFWTDPFDELVPYTPGLGPREAPWPLIYADLMASNDGRQREAAQRFKALKQGEVSKGREARKW